MDMYVFYLVKKGLFRASMETNIIIGCGDINLFELLL